VFDGGSGDVEHDDLLPRAWFISERRYIQPFGSLTGRRIRYCRCDVIVGKGLPKSNWSDLKTKVGKILVELNEHKASEKENMISEDLVDSFAE
jgi:hypothetical protein